MCARGSRRRRRPVVALCDAGIILDAETLCRAAAPLSDKVGLVLALKAGEAPENFAAELERAYIDGHQARFLFAADRLGLAVASGGVTLMSHDTLQRIGNWRGFNRWIADDYSVTRSVRELGLQTRLGDVMPRLPLGRRDWPVVWRRQVRWARTRLRLAGVATGSVGAGDRLGSIGRGCGGGLAAAGFGRRHVVLVVSFSTPSVVARGRKVVHGRPRPGVRIRAPPRRPWCARRWRRCSWSRR